MIIHNLQYRKYVSIYKKKCQSKEFKKVKITCCLITLLGEIRVFYVFVCKIFLGELRPQTPHDRGSPCGPTPDPTLRA